MGIMWGVENEMLTTMLSKAYASRGIEGVLTQEWKLKGKEHGSRRRNWNST